MERATYMQSYETLGTTVEFRIVATDPALVEVYFVELWKLTEDFKERYSRFIPESELSQFNKKAGSKVSITSEFRNILLRARSFGDMTHGLFNPFVLPALQRAGYVDSLSNPLGLAPSYTAQEVVPHTNLEIGDGWARIPKGTAIDLGGIGKGYLADQLGMYLKARVPDFNLSLGGDIYVHGQDAEGFWEIDVESEAGDTIAAYIGEKEPFGIATSGCLRRSRSGTQEHIIDPRTNAVVECVYPRATVVAKDAVTADVLASCILIEGSSAAKRLVETSVVDAVLLQTQTGEPEVYGTGFFVESTAEPV